MKRTITVAAYRRPEYLRQVLDSLAVALRNCPEWPDANVLVSIDPGADSARVYDIACSFRWPVILWQEHMGVNEHPRRLLQVAFNELNSEFNLHLEDDTVLSPDAIRLAYWYSEQRHAESDLGLCLYAHSLDLAAVDPAALYRSPDFSAWGWGCTNYKWLRYLAPYWNHKRSLPIGWDWSISDTMRAFNLRIVAPELSRVKNIGRENGQYQTPEGYDRDFAGHVAAGYNEAREITDFRIVK